MLSQSEIDRIIKEGLEMRQSHPKRAQKWEFAQGFILFTEWIWLSGLILHLFLRLSGYSGAQLLADILFPLALPLISTQLICQLQLRQFHALFVVGLLSERSGTHEDREQQLLT